MTSETTNKILRAITERAPLSMVLSDICRLAREDATGTAPIAGACIFLVDSDTRSVRLGGQIGLPGLDANPPRDPRRALVAMERLLREGGSLPLIIDNPAQHPLTGTLFPEPVIAGFEVAWLWLFEKRPDSEAGLLVDLLPQATAPTDEQCVTLECCARLAALAAGHCGEARTASGPAEMLETLVDNVNQGIALFGKDLTLIHYNRAYASMYNFGEGYPRRGLHYTEILHHLIERGEFGEVDAEAYVQDRMRNMDEGAEWRNLRHRPDGSVVAVYRKNLIGGGAIITMTDVTEDLRLSLENQRNARLLENVVSNINHGIRVIDAEGRLALWNKRYQELCGYPDHLLNKGVPYEVILRYLADKEGMPAEETKTFIDSRLNIVHGGEMVSSQRAMTDGPVVKIDRVPMPDGGFVSTYTASPTSSRQKPNSPANPTC